MISRFDSGHGANDGLMKATITIITSEGPEDFRLNLSRIYNFQQRCKGHEREVAEKIEEIKRSLQIVLWWQRPVWITIESKMNDENYG